MIRTGFIDHLFWGDDIFCMTYGCGSSYLVKSLPALWISWLIEPTWNYGHGNIDMKCFHRMGGWRIRLGWYKTISITMVLKTLCATSQWTVNIDQPKLFRKSLINLHLWSQCDIRILKCWKYVFCRVLCLWCYYGMFLSLFGTHMVQHH